MENKIRFLPLLVLLFGQLLQPYSGHASVCLIDIQLKATEQKINSDGAIAQGYVKNNFGKTQKFIPETMGGKTPRFAFKDKTVEKPASITLYPQPANETVNVKFTNAQKGAGELQIKDITGKQIESIIVQNIAVEFNFSTALFKNGVYILEAFDSGMVKIGTQKLIVAK